MTLIDLVNYICTKCGLLEAEDLAACRTFVSKRYELIYNSALWKDSLAGVDITVDPTNADNAEGIVLLPEVIDRVVAVRTHCNPVQVRGLEDFYRVPYDKFMQKGSPWEFAILSPLWFVWRGFVGLRVIIDAAATKPIKVTWRDETGKRFTQLLNNNSLLNSVAYGDDLIPAGAVYDGSALYYVTMVAGQVYYYTPGNSGQLDLADQVINAAGYFTPNAGFVVGALSGGAGILVTDKVQPAKAARLEIEAVFKPTTTQPVSLNPQGYSKPQPAGGTLAPTDTRSPSYQRIRLAPIPQIAVSISVLGKMKFVPLDFDSEEPALRNLDNCLIAFGCADMQTYARQLGKADSFMKEGEVLLEELMKLETVQAANNQRIIPSEGFGDRYFGPDQYWGGFGF